MNNILLSDLKSGDALQLYFGYIDSDGKPVEENKNINNTRYKVSHVGLEDGEYYAVVKHLTGKGYFDLKILNVSEWKIFTLYKVDIGNQEINEWLEGDKNELCPVIGYQEQIKLNQD